MCGIAGLLQKRPDERLRAAFVAASRTYLRRRGPDAFACAEAAPGLIFAHARLSIIDLACGAQPMEDEDACIVFNGEIYNHQDLRDPGTAYRTHSDTEVLLKGLNARGAGFLADVDGMFAFAHYDKARRRLTLARDLFGQKPIYYLFDGQSFAFASRLQPLMLLSRKEIDRQGYAEYYAGRACRAPRTIFSDVHELRAGEALVFDVAAFSILSVERWAPPLRRASALRDERDALDKLDAAMRLSVRRHLVSDVPVAVFLSGGIDSSLVTALAARENPELSAFSIGFTDPRFDESRYAAAVAQRYGLRLHVRYCGPAEFMGRIEDWPEIMDDAVADPSAIMLAVIAEHARDLGYKVVLAGEGADELFAGYNQYLRFVLASRGAQVGRHLPFLPGLAARLASGRSRTIQAVRSATADPHFYGAGTIFEPYLLPEIVETGGLAAPERAATLLDALALDASRRLPDDMLTRTDRATMHASIETRLPFLTPYVWDLASSLAEGLLIRGRTKKYLLRRLAQRYVPDHCINRPKVGFDLPLAHWLRGPLRDYAMDHLAGTWQADHLRPGAMAGVMDAHMRGANDNADKIWAFVLLEDNVRRLRAVTCDSVLAEADQDAPASQPRRQGEPAIA